MFEKATQLKLRFETVKGSISVEDLWDLPLTSKNQFDLDSVAKGISKALKEVSEESFVTPNVNSEEHKEFSLKLDIVKHIIALKLKDLEDKKLAALKKDKKDHILRLIKQKQDEAFSNKSIEELEAELKDL